MKKISVVAIASSEHEGLYLFGRRRDNRKITIPGGHANEGEAPEAAAKRELLEETGLEGENFRLLTDDQFQTDDGQIHVHLYTCDIDQGQINTKDDPDSEFTEMMWADPLSERDDWHVPPHRNLLAIYLLNKKGLQKSEAADKETAKIKENKKSPEAQKQHDFKAAKWTHPNGHPRCIVCGDEERIGGKCEGLKNLNKADLEKMSRPKLRFPNFGTDPRAEQNVQLITNNRQKELFGRKVAAHAHPDHIVPKTNIVANPDGSLNEIEEGTTSVNNQKRRDKSATYASGVLGRRALGTNNEVTRAGTGEQKSFQSALAGKMRSKFEDADESHIQAKKDVQSAKLATAQKYLEDVKTWRANSAGKSYEEMLATKPVRAKAPRMPSKKLKDDKQLTPEAQTARGRDTDTTIEHEAAHGIFDTISHKYGPVASQNAKKKLVESFDPETYKHVAAFTASRGYKPSSDHFSEEVLNAARDILTSPKRRAAFASKLGDKAPEVIKKLKQSWQKAYETSQKLTPADVTDDMAKKSELAKGANQRLFPYNPGQTPRKDRAKVEAWQEEKGSREKLPELTGNARIRALKKLAALTKWRRNPNNGEAEFLLHRGAGPQEDQSSHKDSMTSWSPKHDVANGFAHDYLAEKGPETPVDERNIFSHWIPESAIHHIPIQVGPDLQPGTTVDALGNRIFKDPKASRKIGANNVVNTRAIGTPNFRNEFEVVVKPNYGGHKASSSEVLEAQSPEYSKDVNTRINDRASNPFDRTGKVRAKKPGKLAASELQKEALVTDKQYRIHYKGQPITKPMSMKSLIAEHGPVQTIEKDKHSRVVAHEPKLKKSLTKAIPFGNPELKFQDPEHVNQTLKHGTFGLISPERTERTPEENAKNHQALLQEIKQLGHKYTPVGGHWGGTQEKSYMVHGISLKDLQRLGQKYGQMAVIHSENGHHQEMPTHKDYTSKIRGSGHQSGEHLEDNYSHVATIKGPHRFSLNLGNDMSKSVKSPSKHLSQKFLQDTLNDNNISYSKNGKKQVEYHQDEMTDLLTRKKAENADKWADEQYKNMKKEELDKSKNVREQKKKVFGSSATPAVNSPMREKQMQHIARYAEDRYGLPVKRAPGKKNASGQIIDKPELGNEIQHINNPSSMMHELAHIENADSNLAPAQLQDQMDDRWGALNQEIGYKQQSRAPEEYEAHGAETKMRRQLGLPINVRETKEMGDKRLYSAKVPDKQIAMDVPHNGRTRRITALSSNLDARRKLFEARQAGLEVHHPEMGWQESASPDALINRRDMGDPEGAKRLQREKFASRLRERLSAKRSKKV